MIAVLGWGFVCWVGVFVCLFFILIVLLLFIFWGFFNHTSCHPVMCSVRAEPCSDSVPEDQQILSFLNEELGVFSQCIVMLL